MTIEQFLTPDGITYFIKLKDELIQGVFDSVDDDSDTILKVMGALAFYNRLVEDFADDIKNIYEDTNESSIQGGEVKNEK